MMRKTKVNSIRMAITGRAKEGKNHFHDGFDHVKNDCSLFYNGSDIKGIKDIKKNSNIPWSFPFVLLAYIE
jgi:hypothetical protein